MKNLRIRKSPKSVKAGDIFRIGNHVIGCGDAKNPDFVNRVIYGAKIKLICCDPPYGVMAVESKEGFNPLKVNRKILNDDIISESEYAEFTRDWLMPAIPHLTAKNAAYIFNSDKMLFALRKGMELAGMKFAQLLIWIKHHPVIGRKDYLPQHELIAYGWYGTHEFKKAKDKSLLFCPKPNKNMLHPTQKPVTLIRRIILNSTSIGDTVYDCFAGSGTTGVAAEMTKRSSVLIERDEIYCACILERMKRLTGRKEERIL
jgi:DNA modification methylase